MRYQLCDHLPWLIRSRIFGSTQTKPELYEDMIWGPAECEDLSPFRAAVLIGHYHDEPAVPGAVELARSRCFEFPPIEAKAGSSEYDLKATNNGGPVSTRF